MKKNKNKGIEAKIPQEKNYRRIVPVKVHEKNKNEWIVPIKVHEKQKKTGNRFVFCQTNTASKPYRHNSKPIQPKSVEPCNTEFTSRPGGYCHTAVGVESINTKEDISTNHTRNVGHLIPNRTDIYIESRCSNQRVHHKGTPPPPPQPHNRNSGATTSSMINSNDAPNDSAPRNGDEAVNNRHVFNKNIAAPSKKGTHTTWKPSTSDSKFTIHLINVRSIVKISKRIELQAHLNRHAPDAVLLTETWLSSQFNVKLKGYRIFRDDRSDTTGVLKNATSHQNIVANSIVTSFEFSGVVVRLRNGSKIALRSIYRSHRKPLVKQELINLIEEVKAPPR